MIVNTFANIFVSIIKPTLKNANFALKIFVKPKDTRPNKTNIKVKNKKLLLITVLALFATNTISAQDSKGYVGVSIGAALPQGDLRDETNTGLDFGFLNAGYRFDETWGATLNWGATGHAI